MVIVFMLEVDIDLSSVGIGMVLFSDGNGFVDVNVDVLGMMVIVMFKVVLKMVMCY